MILTQIQMSIVKLITQDMAQTKMSILRFKDMIVAQIQM